MAEGDLLSHLKWSKLDYMILVTAFLLIASNQVFSTAPFRASGTIEVTNGASIPQESNYSIASEIVPSVTSAIVLNQTLENESRIFFDVSSDSVSRFEFNFTLQASENNAAVNIQIRLGYYQTSFDVVVGTVSQIFQVEPDMDDVHQDPSYWIQECYITFTAEFPLEFVNVLLWAEFDTPVSPVVLNWQSTDGQGLFDNEYTKFMFLYGPQLRITHQGLGSTGYFDASYQNRTLYLQPQNYSLRVTWGAEFISIDGFNITISENVSSILTLRMKALKLTFSLNQKIPLVLLRIEPYSSSSHEIYRLELQGSEMPEFLWIPPYSSFRIGFYSVDTLSRLTLYYPDADLQANALVQSNGTFHQNIEVKLSYWYFSGFIITPQDLIQISLAAILFFLVIFRIAFYFNTKRPRISLKDPRLIPIVLLGLTVFFPWFSSTRDATYYFGTEIHYASFGAFPLIASWTDSGGIFLDLPSNGVFWALVSVICFWFPLIYANYSFTPPSSSDENLRGILLLFSPLFFFATLQVGLTELYPFPFTPDIIMLSYLVLVPVSYFIGYILLAVIGKFGFGEVGNQLQLDVKLAEQLKEKSSDIGIEETSTLLVEEESRPSPIEIDTKKTLQLVLVIIQFLVLMIPSAIGFYYTRSWETGGYYLEWIFYGTPLSSGGYFLESVFGFPDSSFFWILIFPGFYLLTYGILGEYVLMSRKGLSILLFLLWASAPFVFYNNYVVTLYINVGIEWILISLPSAILTWVTVTKIEKFIKEEIRFHSLLAWIISPVFILIPGGLLLNWIATFQLASLRHSILAWTPLPIATTLLILIIWPLRYWYRNKMQNLEVDSEMDELLHLDDEAGNLS